MDSSGGNLVIILWNNRGNMLPGTARRTRNAAPNAECRQCMDEQPQLGRPVGARLAESEHSLMHRSDPRLAKFRFPPLCSSPLSL